jgi:hypothetical protein
MPTGDDLKTLETDYTAKTNFGMPRGHVPACRGLMERMALLEHHRNANVISLC